MYPLAPVRRMREVPGVAAGLAVDVLRPVSDLFTSDLSSRLGPGEGAILPPRLRLFLLHALLDQFTSGKILLVPWIRGQRFLNGSHRLRILLGTHGD
jgi:hypothetical protein